MGEGAIGRVRLAVLVAAASALGLALLASVTARPATAGPSSLAPDLVTLPMTQESLAIQLEGKRTVLRITNEIANSGSGPLEVVPGPISTGCDGDADPANDRDANQRIYDDADGSGGYEPGIDPLALERRFGCMRFHPAHDHWHVLDFARYDLRREPGGKPVVRKRKVGFCLADSRRVFDGPSSPLDPVYPIEPGDGPEQRGCQAFETQGLSSGWADVYLLDLPGQELDVSGLARGRYCLISSADPRDLITERDESNNSTALRIQLRPKARIARALARPCRG
jgi:hypothetical protein